MKPRVYLYYEDRKAVGARNFPLHDLAVACSADALGREPGELHPRVEFNARGGSGNVLVECRRRAPRLPHVHIGVLLDGDKLHRALPGLRAGYCKTAARAAFRAECADQRLELFVLDDNTETLITRAAERGFHPELIEEALAKSPGARDRVLANLAASARREDRDRVRDAVPSFARFVRTLSQWLGA